MRLAAVTPLSPEVARADVCGRGGVARSSRGRGRSSVARELPLVLHIVYIYPYPKTTPPLSPFNYPTERMSITNVN